MPSFILGMRNMSAERLQEELESLKKEHRHVKALLLNTEKEAQRLKNRLDEARGLNEELTNSTSWKLTAPLRAITHHAKQSIRRLQGAMLNTTIGAGRRVLRFVPLKYHSFLKTAVYRNLSWLLSEEVLLKFSNNESTFKSCVTCARESIPVLRDFSEQSICKTLNAKIAVHIHMFYLDLVQEFVTHLNNIPFSFDLYISTVTEKAMQDCCDAFRNIKYLEKLDIRVVPNRGRDIAPFVVTFGDILKGYDYVSHIHTKKSLYNDGKTDGWREYLLNNLFGSEYRLRQIFSVFLREPEIGLIYPQNYLRLPYAANTWLANRGQAQAWGKRLGIHQIPEGYFDFPAGSMFWARTSAIRSLFDTGIKIDDFPQERGQTDGTLAHTMERMLGALPVANGYDIVAIADDSRSRWSPWCIEPYLNRSKQDIHAKISNPTIKMLVVDVFDTILSRPLLNPESIKRIVASRVNSTTGGKYLKWRSIAENNARKTEGRDVGLDQIYAKLRKLAELSEDEINNLRQIEEYTEIHAVRPRQEVLDFMRFAKKRGKRIVIASDTYLSKDCIEKMLIAAAIPDWDNLYISSDVGLRKDTGELYTFILNQENLKPEQVVVMGDNERSDLQIPVDRGFSSIHIFRHTELARAMPRMGRLVDKTLNAKDLNSEITLGLAMQSNYENVICDHLSEDNLASSDPETIGFSVLAPLLTAFADWLIAQAKMDGVERLYFLSREGEILKKVYDEWATGIGEAPESRYLEVSRRAVLVPTITGLDDIYEIAKETFFSNTVESFLLERYGLELNQNDMEEIYRRRLWQRDRPVRIKNGNIHAVIKLLDYLAPRIISIAESEQDALKDYLQLSGLSDTKNMAVVDVGYSGTIQSRIMELLDCKIHGYYIMTSRKGKDVIEKYDVNMIGAVHNYVDHTTRLPVLYLRNFQFEKFLSSDAAQLLYYKKNKGSPQAIYRELSDPERNSKQIRKSIRKGMLRYAARARQVREEVYPAFSPALEVGVELLESFFRKISKAESTVLENIAHEDHFNGRGVITAEQNRC